MRLRSEVSLGLALLLILQVVTSFSAIFLLDRVTPATADLLAENDASLAAIEDVLVGLLMDDHAAGRARARDGLQRARDNITEEGERAPLQALGEALPDAFDGDKGARAVVIDAAAAVTATNREAMRRANAETLRLGATGSWAAAILGITGFVVGVVVARRLQGRVVAPVVDLASTLARVRVGEEGLRCSPQPGPRELRQLAEHVTWLIDRAQQPPPPAPSVRDRQIIVALLDRVSGPAAIVGAAGAVVACNAAALARLDRAAIVAALDGAPSGWRAEPLDADLWLVVATEVSGAHTKP
jgi:hypothetical protein